MVGDRIVVSGDLPADERLARRALSDWCDAGITGVVDCRGEWSDERFVAQVAPQVGYRHIGIDDDGTRRPDGWFDTGTAGALELLEQTTGRVLVHCHMGINRGPSMAYAVLLCLGWHHVEALDAIRAARPIAALIYAEDAVAWWARRNDVPATVAGAMRRDVRAWHRSNDIDVATVIRRIRAAS
jgi:protein-tyrosine phosphatase